MKKMDKLQGRSPLSFVLKKKRFNIPNQRNFLVEDYPGNAARNSNLFIRYNKSHNWIGSKLNLSEGQVFFPEKRTFFNARDH